MTLNYGGELVEEGDFTEEIAKEISVVKGNRISLEHYYSSCCPDEVFRQIYQGYRKTCQEKRKLDFDDMLLYCYELFDKRKDILAAWQNKFQYILVDEFQDINQLQYDIVRMLAEPQNNLFIVGDDDQSIYHFRGARPEIMLNFTKDYPEAETVLLDVNYRCSSRILTFSHESDRRQTKNASRKNCSTPNETGNRICCPGISKSQGRISECGFRTERTYGKERRPGRHGNPSPYQSGGRRSGRGFDGTTGSILYERKTSQSFSSLDMPKYSCIYAVCKRGYRAGRISLRSMNRPNRYIARDALPMTEISFDALRDFYKDKDWMCDRITTLETHLKILKGLSPYAAINFIRKGMGYEEYLHEYAEYRKIKPEELSEILDRLTESTKGMDSLEEWEKLHRRIYTETGRAGQKTGAGTGGRSDIHTPWCEGAGV